MMKLRYTITLILSAVLLSCVSKKNNIIGLYNTLIEVTHDMGVYYYLPNTDYSNSLIIYVGGGSGFNSELGIFNDKKVEFVQYSYYVLDYFRGKNEVVVLEKPYMQKGMAHYRDSIVIANYTVEGLISFYKASIDFHLQKHSYDNITIIGISEGGLLIPKLYSQLSSKESISSLVMVGSGGLNQYDCFKIQQQSTLNFAKGYKQMLNKLDTIYRDIMDNPTSIKRWYMGWPYNRWSSFFNYSPKDYLPEINVPILYVHGNLDVNVPVEATQAMEALGLSNIEFHYYTNMEHIPLKRDEQTKLFGIIEKWRKK